MKRPHTLIAFRYRHWEVVDNNTNLIVGHIKQESNGHWRWRRLKGGVALSWSLPFHRQDECVERLFTCWVAHGGLRT